MYYTYSTLHILHMLYHTMLYIGVVEPYGFIYDRDDKNPEQDMVLNRGRFPTYAPIL